MSLKNKESKKRPEKEKKKHIWSLTPKVLTEKKDIEKIQPYLDSLEMGLSNPDIKNIALTGDYGSGKSTVLNTFQYQNEDYNFLNLSLASFKDEGEDLEEELEELEEKPNSKKEKGLVESKLDRLNRLIEISILQQLIYQAHPNDIPDSRFQRIIGISDKKLRYFAIGCILWLVSLLILFKYDGFAKADPENWTYSLQDLSLSTFLAIPIFLYGVGFFMFRIGRVLSNSKISKVNIKGELELGKDLDKSILNKHLDEILYFFEQTDYNVVIIEDLDRFRNTQVFTKLREINLLLNKSASIVKQSRKIVFIYALRDEMFVNSERVKFFDYIIPVIPFINPTNAKDQFFNLLKVENLESELDNDFIEDVVTYIDDIDMRLLLNVFQEFSIYKRQMGSGIILENLFALILYKNLYPKDFTKLPRRKGNLYEFIKNKLKYSKELSQEVQEQISDLKIKIENVESERQIVQKELDAIYLSAIKEETDAFEIKLGSEWILFTDLYDKENFDKLIIQDEFEYRHFSIDNRYRQYTSSRRTNRAKFKSIEKLVDKENSFYQRQQFIEDKNSESIEELKEALLDKENLRRKIESWSIQQIFERLDINEYLEKFEHKELLGNLFTNGYIDENYIDYITLFHEAKITISEKEFIKKVKGGKQSDFDYKLSKPSEIIKDIPIRYFSRKEILNYHILGYLLRWGDDFPNKKEAMINQICQVKSGTKEEHDMFRFIDGYVQFYENPENESDLRTSGSIPQLINILSSKTNLLWNTLLSKNLTAQKQVQKYIKLVILHSNPEELRLNTRNSRFRNYLIMNSSVINLFENQDDSQKLATILQKLDIKFSKLVTKSPDNSKIYDFIYTNNHYLLNINNIKEIVSSYNSSDSVIDLHGLEKANYSTIQKSDCKHLIDYIDKNINIYLKDVLLKIPENVEEDEKSVISLLNNNRVDDELKEKIIEMQDVKINDITVINETENVIELIKHEKLEASWSNVFTYYKNSENMLDLFLIDYLNKEHIFKKLCKTKIQEIIDSEDDLMKKFCVSLILCNGLSQSSYSLLLKSIPQKYSSWNKIGFEELDSEKVSFLINNNFLTLTQDNFDLMKENFNEILVSYLVKQQEGIIEAMENDKLNLYSEDMDLLFEAEKVSENLKENLIKDYSRSRIISENKIAALIGSIASKQNRTYLTHEELKSIFSKGENTVKEMTNVLNNHFSKLDSSQIQELTSLISNNHSNIFNSSKRVKFSNTEEIRLLASNLKKKGLVKNYKIQRFDTIVRFYPL